MSQPHDDPAVVWLQEDVDEVKATLQFLVAMVQNQERRLCDLENNDGNEVLA